MNFDEFQTAPCILQAETTGGGCPTLDSRCKDEEWAADHPDLCPNASTIVSLEVVPQVNATEVGHRVRYKAYLKFANGHGKDVTVGSDWASSDNGIAVIDQNGIADANAIGTTTMHATYRGLFDFAQLSVTEPCDQAPMDIMVVLDQSPGMGQGYPGYSRGTSPGLVVDFVRDGLFNLIGAARLDTVDRMGIVVAGGSYALSQLGTLNPAVQTALTLSASKEDLLAAVSMFSPPETVPNRIATSMVAQGLQSAYAEFTSSRARAGARKVIVLVTLGYQDWEGYPSIYDVTSSLRENNVVLIGVVPVPSVYYIEAGSQIQRNNWQFVQSFVSCGLFFGATGPTQVPYILGQVLLAVCQKQGDPCLYYIPYATPTPPPTCIRSALDYTALRNWNVVSGFVDLLGIDLYPITDHGMYLDLVGTDKAHPDSPGAVGTIESKDTFSLQPGRYRLAFELAGNSRQESGAMSVTVSLGALLNETVTVNNWQQAFTSYRYDISVSAATAAKIRFAHNPLPEGSAPTIGLLLDNITLTNLDSGAVLLLDTFDTEHPCP